MADITDVLSTLKNAVVGINALNTTQSDIANAQGTDTSATVTATTLIAPGTGRVVRLSVTVAGSAAGTLNNAAAIGSIAAGNVICIIPPIAGVFDVGLYYTAGLVVVPGTGQSVNVTWSVE